ncbi:hypothetical protein QQ045_014648 [Rhodiola kirilowii]
MAEITHYSSSVATLFFSLLLLSLQLTHSHVSYDRKAIVINGQRKILISGSIHYPRSTPDMWEDLILKAKDGGLDVIDTYVFWNGHEPSPGNYNFEGRYDLLRFIKTIQKAGLYAHLRIGPYVCAEWNFGGFPVWLKFVPGISFRTDNDPFKQAMQGFTEKIVGMMKREGLFEPQGGPIILAQIENEYGALSKELGAPGHNYLTWAANMATSLNTRVPWVMCKQDNAPDPMINTCNGFYCDQFYPNQPYKPKMWTEAWTGWFSEFGGTITQRPVEDMAFAVARFIQSGGSFVNYYMYHGGTNFGRTAGGPFLTTSYDYDAPIDEYGLLRQPKHGHLKELHRAIKMCEPALVSADPVVTSLGSYQQAHVYTTDSGECAAFLSNFDRISDAVVLFNSMRYRLPRWSISILPDCRNVVYNTAKIGVQTTKMAMVPGRVKMQKWHSYAEDPLSLDERLTMTTTGLLEQINVTRDTSDYLWYITRVDVSRSESFLHSGELPTLLVQSHGHAVHIFVNGKHSGSAFGSRAYRKITYRDEIRLRAGTNQIALLSVAVGLQNIGGHFETWETGILGPVVLYGLDDGRRDLSGHKWTYQIGLKGEAMNLESENALSASEWMESSLLAGRQPPLTWHKATFDAPGGDDPVALDMNGMGKGQIWINEKSIGRYWTTLATGNCSECSYNQTFRPPRCQVGCGKPTQRWYHVPQSWLKPTMNRVVIFEELGGDPSRIKLVERKISTVCGSVFENHPMIKKWEIESYGKPQTHLSPKVRLRCPTGQYISEINFVSYGTPSGTCGSFKLGNCHAQNSHSIFQKICIGRRTCSVAISERNFGQDPCPRVLKRLAVEAACSRIAKRGRRS